MKKVFGIFCLVMLALGAAAAFAVPIPNGDFSSGNTDFTSGYTYFPVPLTPANSYSGSSTPASLYDEKTYGVGTDPGAYHVAWAHFGDHTTGTGNMMIVNGSTDVGTQVWGQPVSPATIGVTAGTTYYFSAWLASIYPSVGQSPIAPATLAFSINGNQVGSNFTLTAPVGTWQLFFVPWVADSSTATLSLVNRNTVASGNDFALDDISFGTRSPVPEPTTVLLLGLGLVGLWGTRRKLKK